MSNLTRAVVNVATTPYYQRGATRLMRALELAQEPASVICWRTLPPECPAHDDVPYAFKAFALREAAKSADLLLWCDSCILPVRSLAPLWERIERDGYWMAPNGFTNYEWTADSAYRDLFPYTHAGVYEEETMALARASNRNCSHVIATCFGLNVHSGVGAAFLVEYFRLASETRAFRGPWINANSIDAAKRQALNEGASGGRVAPCGPPDVRGHRHDQTAASVIAWRLGMKLTPPPEVLIYGRAEDATDERTLLVADGSYQ